MIFILKVRIRETVFKSANLSSGLPFKVAKHWIAGESYEEAVERAEHSNVNNLSAILNLLGEEVRGETEVAAATAEYVKVLEILAARKIRGCISVKPTQLGLAINRSLYEENLGTILATAKKLGTFVWIDMEGSNTISDTIESYLGFLQQFENVGVAIQAYLKRSKQDVERILDSKGVIRLVKGAYNESSTIAFKRRNEISDNYETLMGLMFERGNRFAIATHDEKLLERASDLAKTQSVDFEYEMLMGIRDAKKLELARRGFRVSEYIPYGKGWWAYSVRRIREHKSNILLLARSLVSG